MPKKISENLTAVVFSDKYHHQTFKKCVPIQYAHFYAMMCQMLPQVMDSPLILLRFFVYFYTLLMTIQVS